MGFDDILRSILGMGQQQEQPYGPQLPGQQQIQQQAQQMPQQGFQTPYQWKALTMANSGESWSDTLTKAAAITQQQQKVDNEKYEMQMKQQQLLAEMQQKETLAKYYESQGNNEMANLIRNVAANRPEQAAALYEATNAKPQAILDSTIPGGVRFVSPPPRGKQNNAQQGSSVIPPKQNIDDFVADAQDKGWSPQKTQLELNKKFPKEMAELDNSLIPKIDLSQESEHERQLRQITDAKFESETGGVDKINSDLRSALKLADKTLDKVETGLLTPAKVIGAKLWDETGGKVFGKQNIIDVKKAELLESLFKTQIIPLVKKFPGSLAVKELNFLIDSSNSMFKSREGNREILEMTRAIVMKAEKFMDLRTKYHAKNKTYQGFDNFWRDYQKKAGLEDITQLPREEGINEEADELDKLLYEKKRRMEAKQSEGME